MLRTRVVISALLTLVISTPAWAQSPSDTQTQPPPSPPPAEEEERRATTTFFGDTGLWFVPTAEVLGSRRWSVSGYRANWDRNQGFTDISHFAVTFGVGIGDRAEVFGSWRAVTRIDRDVRPIFAPERNDVGGQQLQYPFVREGWIGDRVGDLYLGAKVSLLSESREQPVALAVRGMVKVPTGDEDEGAGTGKADVHVGAVGSKEINEVLELAGFGGVVFRGDPDDTDLSHGLEWGVGAGFPTRQPLRVFAELRGEAPFDDEVTSGRVLTGFDGSRSPLVSPFDAPIDATIGLVWQASNGFFAGAGLNWSARIDGRSDAGLGFEDESGDSLGFQVRLGYHPGVRSGPPLAPPPPPPAPVVPQNRPPTVKARCEPCTVEVGKSSTVTADAQDPDGDQLTYKWAAPTGTLASPTTPQTLWTAPNQEGPVPVTVTVDDGKGGTASDTVTIQVIRPAVKQFVFEDVHFDFDRYRLREDATRILDEAVTAMRENPTLRLEIEGHTCSIGTAEYNLALGERRAQSVQEYLASRGIGADRLRTVSYGEERPKHDNAREETRRLNRRAALVVRMVSSEPR